MDRAYYLKNELSIKARHRRKLEDVLLAVDEIHKETTKEIHDQIDVVSDKIQDGMEDND